METGLWYPCKHPRPDDYDMCFNTNDAVRRWASLLCPSLLRREFILCREIFNLLCQDIFATGSLLSSRASPGAHRRGTAHEKTALLQDVLNVESAVRFLRLGISRRAHLRGGSTASGFAKTNPAPACIAATSPMGAVGAWWCQLTV